MSFSDLIFEDSSGLQEALAYMKKSNNNLEFVRMFRLYDFNESSIRGKHAHYKCWQYLKVVAGSLSLKIITKDKSTTLILKENQSFLAPPYTWLELKGDRSTQILVLCSHQYDKGDYIYDLRAIANDRK